YFEPPEPLSESEIAAAAKTEQSSSSIPSSSAVTASTKTAPSPAAIIDGEYPTNDQIAEYEQIEIATSSFNASISLLGGRLTALRLNDYKEQNRKESQGQNMVEHTDGLPYPLGIVSGGLDDSHTVYQLSNS